MLPFSRHCDAKNLARKSVCTYEPFSVYSFSTASHLSWTVVFMWIFIKVKSGHFWVSSDFADRSSFSHWILAAVSLVVGGFERGGASNEPLKWPQKPFTSMALQKRMRKMAQFGPVAWRLGMDNGRASEREAVFTVVITIVDSWLKISLSKAVRAHNLLSRQKQSGKQNSLLEPSISYTLYTYEAGPCTIYVATKCSLLKLMSSM